MLYKVTYIGDNTTYICTKNLEGPNKITLNEIAKWKKELYEDYNYMCKYITIIGWDRIHKEEECL